MASRGYVTGLVRPYFKLQHKQTERLNSMVRPTQESLLKYLLRRASGTVWGERYGFGRIRNYEEFRERVPLTTYEELHPMIERARAGERDVLWPGRTRWFAKSSGTTNDKSKFIPITGEGLSNIHYAGGKDTIAYYLNNHPESHMFDGRSLILGGSFDPAAATATSRAGDLSAVLISQINRLANLVRTPSQAVALLPDFEEKRHKIALTTMKQNVTNISGVPSWMLSTLTHMLEIAGREKLDEIWPNLEVFFHGGVAFTPYRDAYKRLCTLQGMSYMETYNASEGFFGLQTDPEDAAMQLMVNYGVFYEFLPLHQVGHEDARAIPAWEVETGEQYAMVISTTCGLWRYQIGDTVCFTKREPLKFYISGRTKSFINAFGEELMVDNAEKGLHAACLKTGAEVREYTAAPVFMDAHAKGRHQWAIEFGKEPGDLEEFADALDASLRQLNSDYDAKRFKDISLQRLEIVKVHQGVFDLWLKGHGKLGGQHKVPRLCNDRHVIDEILLIADK